MHMMTIRQVAREVGIGVETIRFCEREGLLERPARRQSGYRQFELSIARLRFIKQAQRLCFTLREVRELLALKLNPSAKRSQLRERALVKVADIEQRIRDLKRMKKSLAPLIKTCDGQGTLEGCPILYAIEKPCLEHQ